MGDGLRALARWPCARTAQGLLWPCAQPRLRPQLSETAAKVLRPQRAPERALTMPGTSVRARADQPWHEVLTGPEEVRARVRQPWHEYEVGSGVADELIQIHTHDAGEEVLDDGTMGRERGKGIRGIRERVREDGAGKKGSSRNARRRTTAEWFRTELDAIIMLATPSFHGLEYSSSIQSYIAFSSSRVGCEHCSKML